MARQALNKQAKRFLQAGFALPTILITSVVMLIVMLAAIETVQSVNVALDDEQMDQIGRAAADSGLVMAKACLAQNGKVTWTDASPLRPGGDCNGLASECTSVPNCYLVSTGNIRSTFTVPAPKQLSDGSFSVNVSSRVDKIRTSNGKVWKSYTEGMNQLGRIQLITWSQVVVNSYDTCAVTQAKDAIYCWGSGNYGELGNGSTDNNLTTAVPVDMTGVLAGKTISAFMDGGSWNSCVVASDRQSYCWGFAASGLGLASPPTYSAVPIAAPAQGEIPTAVTEQQAVPGGCVLGSDQWAYCWGSMTGNGSSGSTTPTKVAQGAIPSGAQITQLAGATCVLANAWPYCWGDIGIAGYSNIGNGSTSSGSTHTPVAVSRGDVPSTATATQVAKSVSDGGGCILASNGRPYCWGVAMKANVPKAVTQGAAPSSATYTKLFAGAYNDCGLTSTGDIYCWGSNSSGQLGNGTTTDSNDPVKVVQGDRPAGVTFTGISGNDATVCGTASDGNVYCWGNNYNNHLGTGNTSATYSSTPVKVTVLPKWVLDGDYF